VWKKLDRTRIEGKSLLQDIVEGTIEGKTPRGRPRVKMFDGLIGDVHYSVIKSRPLDRNEWKG